MFEFFELFQLLKELAPYRAARGLTKIPMRFRDPPYFIPALHDARSYLSQSTAAEPHRWFKAQSMNV